MLRLQCIPYALLLLIVGSIICAAGDGTVRPLVLMGPIVCDVNPLVLRSSTVCKASLHDSVGAPMNVTAADVALSEENGLGALVFRSGEGGTLRFSFEAPAALPEFVSSFLLTAHIVGTTTRQSVTVPFAFPFLPPVSEASVLRCDDDIFPIVCTLHAADDKGPVRFEAGAFSFDMKGWNSSTKLWVHNLHKFYLRIVTDPIRADRAYITWDLKLNNVVNPHQLHAHVVAVTHMEVLGSPFSFTSGVMPTAQSVSLRDCDTHTLRARSQTNCYFNLHNGVSGDPRYFHFSSTRNALFVNAHYVPPNSSVTPPSLPLMAVTYIAPEVQTRAEDRLYLHLHGVATSTQPIRMTVLPIYDASTDDNNKSSRATIVAVGLIFYGSTLGIGFFLIVRRARKTRRIRSERAAKEQREATAADAGVVPRAAAREADAQEVVVELVERVASLSLSAAPQPPQAATSPSAASAAVGPAVISNAAVVQTRLHRDEDESD